MPDPKLAAKLAAHRTKRSQALLERRFGSTIKRTNPSVLVDRAKELHSEYLAARAAFYAAHPGASTVAPPVGSPHTDRLVAAQRAYYVHIQKMRRQGVPLPKVPDLRKDRRPKP